MKTIFILLTLALLGITEQSIAQSNPDTLYFKHTFWRGLALWRNNHFVKVKQLRTQYGKEESLKPHFRTLMRARISSRLSVFGATWLTASGVLGFIVQPSAYIPNTLNLISGIGVTIGNYAMMDQEEEELKFIAAEINRMERK